MPKKFHFADLLDAVETKYKGNCQDSRHEAHGEKYLLTERFDFFSEFIFNSVYHLGNYLNNIHFIQIIKEGSSLSVVLHSVILKREVSSFHYNVEKIVSSRPWSSRQHSLLFILSSFPLSLIIIVYFYLQCLAFKFLIRYHLA